MRKQKLERDDIEAFLDEPGANRTKAAAHFGVSRATVARTLGGPAYARKPEREAKALAFIEGYIGEHGWAPSIREIATGIGVTPATAHMSVATLERDGKIVTGGGPRMIRLVGP